MYSLVRKALFIADPETAHGLALDSLRLGHGVGATRLLCKAENIPVRVMGLQFPNPVGMAAGMDKNGDYIDALGSLGFGFIEVGTVTPRPQPGNPKPRMFRLESKQAIPSLSVRLGPCGKEKAEELSQTLDVPSAAKIRIEESGTYNSEAAWWIWVEGMKNIVSLTIE